MLGDLPKPYFYIMDGGGEAIQAKRRGAAVIISHLTPMIVNGGRLPDFQTLHEALENLEKTEGNSSELAAEYKKRALEEIRRLKLDAQLGLDLADWESTETRVHKFLHDTENDTVPLGIHTVGSLPPEPNQRDGLAAFIRYNFDDRDLPGIDPFVEGWAATMAQGGKPTVSPTLAEGLRQKAEATLLQAESWLANLRRSGGAELDALVTVLAGRHLPSGPLGDPLRVPGSLPTGRNEHAGDAALIPTKAAWVVGRKMADEFIARFRTQHGAFPEKVSLVLWYGETSRHQGALESMALFLMGVEPIWNARGVPDSLTLIPDDQLGRPRVDVVFTISGIYRDGFPEKVLLLDRAVRLAASAGDNAISRHDRQIADDLAKAGTDGLLAGQMARARIFGTKPSSYGIGVGQIVEQSKDADGRTADLSAVYLHNMNYAFSSETWGGTATGALTQHLRGNQAVVFSRANNLNGVLDNDDTYQYFGGLSVASKTINGAAPDMYINNLRKAGAESVTDLRSWLAAELNTRNWNPTWLKEMQRSGYAGAREMAREMEYLYGFQATAAEQMDGTFWQQSFDVLVADKHGLGLDAFFERANPHAQQSILARMLEVDRQGSYRFSDQDREILVHKYVESVARHGVSCSANTCGNVSVHQYIGRQTSMYPGLGREVLQRFGRRLARATHWEASVFADSNAAIREGAAEATTAPQPVPPTPPPVAEPAAPRVTGFRLEERILTAADPIARTVSAWVFVGMILALLMGMGVEARRLGPRQPS
ncbi:MAG: cobaltochelatase subunit CobN [Vicinamibacterales bacterium]